MTAGPDDLVALFRERAAELPDWLRGHVGRVVSEGRRLAQVHEVDVERVQAGAWGHDLYRAHGDAALLSEAARVGITPSVEEAAAPILLHGPIAAAEAKQAWGVRDDAVLEAIHWHTTGRPAMSDVALTVFVADKIELAKVEADPGLLPIRALAEHDLLAAMAALLDRRLAALLALGGVVHPAAVEARNWYLAALAERAGRDAR